MDNPALPGLPGAPRRRPGRPKGSTNKRNGDLQRYVEAQFSGLTPGQQSAQLALVTAKELKAAGGDLLVAMVNKAKLLASGLECENKEAWLLMQRERSDLLPYIHQKRPPKAEDDGKDQAPMQFVAVPMEDRTAAGDGSMLGEWDTPPDMLENQGVSDPIAGEVTTPKSQEGQQTLTPQGIAEPVAADDKSEGG